MLWRDYFRGLLLSRRIMLHLAIWVETADDMKCESPDLKSADDYPYVFESVDMDTDGVKVRMSGMFGNVTYKRVDDEWIEVEYNARDNTGVPASLLSWAT